MNLEQYHSWWQQLSQTLTTPFALFLQGDLGAGKTEAVKALLKDTEACSPTYSLHHEYFWRGAVVHHWDFYRLQSSEELESSGFWDLWIREHESFVIEWPERISWSGPSYPNRRLLRVKIDVVESERQLHLKDHLGPEDFQF